MDGNNIMQFIENEQSETSPFDMAKTRIVDLGTNKVYMKQKDPYWFIYLNYERGAIPDKYTGAYTGWREAEEAVHRLKQDRERAEQTKTTSEKKN